MMAWRTSHEAIEHFLNSKAGPDDLRCVGFQSRVLTLADIRTRCHLYLIPRPRSRPRKISGVSAM